MEKTRFISVNISPSKILIACPYSKAIPFSLMQIVHPAAVQCFPERCVCNLTLRCCSSQDKDRVVPNMLSPEFLCKAEIEFASAVLDSVGFF